MAWKSWLRIFSFTASCDSRRSLPSNETFQLAGDRPRNAASLRDNAVGLDVAELYAGRERRILRLRLNLEVARDLAVARVRGDLRKLESGGIITHRRLEFREEKSVTQG